MAQVGNRSDQGLPVGMETRSTAQVRLIPGLPSLLAHPNISANAEAPVYLPPPLSPQSPRDTSL